MSSNLWMSSTFKRVSCCLLACLLNGSIDWDWFIDCTINLSDRLFKCACEILSVCLPVSLFVFLSVFLSVGTSACPSVCPSVCLSACLSVCPSVCPLSVCPSVRLSVRVTHWLDDPLTNDWVTDWLYDWLNNWVSDWVINWLNDWPIDWLNNWMVDFWKDCTSGDVHPSSPETSEYCLVARLLSKPFLYGLGIRTTRGLGPNPRQLQESWSSSQCLRHSEMYRAGMDYNIQNPGIL